jgi:hypothetical protein
MDLDKVQQILPIGKIGLPQHPIPTDHIYFISQDQSAIPGRLPGPNIFRAPADGVIVRIQKFRWTNQVQEEYDDYHLYILHSNDFMTFIGHVFDPDPDLLHKAGDLKDGENYVFIRVKAGEVLGRGTTPDFGVFDRTKPNAFIKPSRYEPIMLYAQPPFGYLKEDISSRMLSLIWRTGEPKSGSFVYDQAGKLIGNWFAVPDARLNEMSWDDMLAFAPHYLDPRRIEVGFSGRLWSDTSSLGPEYLVAEDAGDPDPADVTPAIGPVRYHLEALGGDGTPGKQAQLTLLVQMLDDTTLKAELFPGWQDDVSFGEGVVLYYR